MSNRTSVYPFLYSGETYPYTFEKYTRRKVGRLGSHSYKLVDVVVDVMNCPKKIDDYVFGLGANEAAKQILK